MFGYLSYKLAPQHSKKKKTILEVQGNKRKIFSRVLFTYIEVRMGSYKNFNGLSALCLS